MSRSASESSAELSLCARRARSIFSAAAKYGSRKAARRSAPSALRAPPTWSRSIAKRIHQLPRRRERKGDASSSSSSVADSAYLMKQAIRAEP